MSRMVIASVIALVAATVVADEAADRQARMAKLRERRERVYRQTGGTIIKPGSQKGKIRFVSSVATVNKALIEKQYEQYRLSYPFDIDVVSGEAVTVETAAAAKAKAGFDIAVFIVDSASTAPMIAAPEEGWAIVNNRACGTPERTSKEAMKAYVYIAGGVNSTYGLSFLSTTKPQELDSVAVVDIPLDVSEGMRKQLEMIKITPQTRAHYNVAVEQGWAPPPTNDVQKAIWDRIRAEPSNPIKIKYDPKKGI